MPNISKFSPFKGLIDSSFSHLFRELGLIRKRTFNQTSLGKNNGKSSGKANPLLFCIQLNIIILFYVLRVFQTLEHISKLLISSNKVVKVTFWKTSAVTERQANSCQQ